MAPELRTCARCGSPVAPEARFCPTCGAPQGEVPREERRVVTVLFGDLSGFTELSEMRDAEEVKRITDRAFEGIAEIVTLYGGRVDKIIGDEIMAVFGAPLAHEDDAERAVRAALEIQRSLAKYAEELERESGIGLQMHVGINTGEVVAGFVGGSDSYTVIGDAVNTARRIEDAAEPGQTLVGAATYEATRGAIEYRSIGQVTAKGKRLPVEAWEALAERGLPGERAVRTAPLIGREDELTVLEGLARIVRRDGRPAAATIVGDAGMGKSRVAAEFARRMASTGVRVLHGRSLPYGTASPAFAVQEILRGALLLDPLLEHEQACAWIRQRLEELGVPGEADRVAALLGVGGAVAAREQQATGPAAASQPAAGTSALLDAARAVLERVAAREGLLVLSFHELHWAEDAVLEFVESLLRTARAPLLAVCLARTGLLERRPGWAGGSVRMTVLAMEPLPREAAEHLLGILAPSLPPALRESVLERAGGNPFYLEELARLLVERTDVSDGTIPVGLQALVTARIDALPPDAKRALQDAAVVGEQFWPGALRALDSLPDEMIVTELRTLADHDFIEGTDGAILGGEAGFRFRQTLVREVAYGSVPKHLRARQHLAVGAWLEGVAGAEDGGVRLDDLVAYHFERAAVLAREVGTSLPDAEAKARAYLERAGRASLGLDAAGTAAGFFERALGFATDDADALAVRIQLGEALLGSWQAEAAEQHLTAALRDAQRLGDRATEGKALRLLGDLFRMRGEAERAREPLERALMIAKEIGDAHEEAEGLRSHGLLDLHRGRWSAAVLWFRQALARYRHPMLADPRGEGWSLQNLGWANLLLGRFDEAIAALEEGQEVFAGLGDVEGAGWCLSLRAWAMLMRGQIDEAATIAEQLEGVLSGEQAGVMDTFELDMQVVLRSYASVLRGRLGPAQDLARRVLDRPLRAGAGWVHAMARYPVFYAAMLARRFGDARAAADAGARAAASAGDPLYQGQFVFARAWLALEDGRPHEAERAVERQAATGEAGQMWAQSAAVRWLRARILLATGRAAEARRLLEGDPGRLSVTIVSPGWIGALLAEVMLDQGDAAGAVERARAATEEAGEAVIGRAVALRVLARALLAAGRPEEAHDAIGEELRMLDDADWTVERVRALAVLAPILDALRRHDESAETLDRARALIGALPAGTDAGALERELLA